MPTHEHIPAAPRSPIEPLTEPLDWLLSTMLHVSLGIALGVLAVNAMRRRNLRCTWALMALVFVVLARPALAGWSSTLATAALCAALRARHRHREDLLAGGDLAEIAESRRGPLTLLHRLARESRLRLSRRRARPAVLSERVSLGVTQSGRAVSVPFGAHDGGRHTLVVGATGSGKTVTETWIAIRAIEAGLGAVVIDPKGDARMRHRLAQAAGRVGSKLIEWAPDGPSVYNPFGHGSPTEIADKALAVERFTEPHYQRQAQRYLGHAVRALRGAGVTVSLAELVRQLDPARLGALAESLPEGHAQATYDYLESLSARQRADLSGVRDRLAVMAESDVAPWLDPSTPGARTFDLLSSIRRRAVVYFALNADAWPLLAHMLGVAIVQDLRSTAAALQRSPVATVVVIDEFAAIAAEQVAHLFGRARSAGINLLLGAQELSDLRLDARGTLLEQVLGNLSTLIAHRQVVPESSELVAALSGSRGAWRASQSSEGRWTRTRISGPLIAPHEIRELPPGWAAVTELGARGSARVVRVFS